MANKTDPLVYPAKKTDAKNLSKWGQVIAALWIAGACVLKFLKMDPAAIEVQDIVISGVAIGGCFSPTFVSIWIDKLVEIKRLRYSPTPPAGGEVESGGR